MHRSFLVATFLVLGVPPAGMALEFNDTDVFPFFEHIVFSQTAVGFPASRHYRQALKLDHFVLNRDTGAFVETDSQAFDQAFPDWQHQIERPAEQHGFVTRDAYCAEGGSGHHKKLLRNGTVIPVPIGLCSSISVLRVIGDQAWLGTLTAGEGSQYGAEGIVVLSVGDGSHRKTVLLPGAVGALRLDPYSGNVWVATQMGVFEIDRDINLVSEHHFYHDFDANTGEPRLWVADTEQATNPFAIVAYTLGLEKADQKAFYEATQSIPRETRDNFSVYNYIMGHIGQSFPTELNVLVPFMIKAARSGSVLQKLNTWYVRICRFDDKRAADFFLEESKERHVAGILLACLKKYGLEKEAEQTKFRELRFMAGCGRRAVNRIV